SPGLANSPTITTPAMTQLGVILGTAAYMSPEQAKGRAADKRSDVWAFGCVLYEMLTGKRAFEGDDVSDTLAAVLRADPDWSALPSDTPAPIQNLLRRSLEKDRNRRLADIADARLDIDDALTAPAAKSTARIRTTGARRERLPWIVAAACLTIAVVAIALASHQWPRDEAIEYRTAIVAPEDAAWLSIPPQRFSLSPDGKLLAFVAGRGRGGRTTLWVRPLNAVRAQQLPGTEDALAPFWSPDSRWIGFFTNGKLKKIAVSGG